MQFKRHWEEQPERALFRVMVVAFTSLAWAIAGAAGVRRDLFLGRRGSGPGDCRSGVFCRYCTDGSSPYLRWWLGAHAIRVLRIPWPSAHDLQLTRRQEVRHVTPA